VTGHAGIGKSLVNELQKQIIHGGFLVSGKFDFLAGSVPYAPIAHALRGAMRAVLGEPPAALARRKQSWLDALGPNGRLLTDLVSELELVIGPQPKVPVLDPSESQHRFELVFLSFLRAFAERNHPLVLPPFAPRRPWPLSWWSTSF